MGEEKATNVGPTKIDVVFERFGDPAAPPVLLVMGVAAQLHAWPTGFCDQLVEHGLQVVRFDNRDVGLSTHFSAAPVPDLPAALAGDVSSASYTLSDLAADTVGLLDVLGFPSAHLVGASMGGMIAQTVAIEHPARVRSLTTMMSTTGDPSVGQPAPATMAAFGAPPTDRAGVLDQMVRVYRAAGSTADEGELRERAARSYDRSYDPIGVARQAVAVIASGDRTERLRSVRVPTLVLHGTADSLCDVSGGRATAAAVPGAELVLLEGMGHDLPPARWTEITGRIAEHVRRVEG